MYSNIHDDTASEARVTYIKREKLSPLLRLKYNFMEFNKYLRSFIDYMR